MTVPVVRAAVLPVSRATSRRKVLTCRDTHRVGRDQIAVMTGVAARTVSRILARHDDVHAMRPAPRRPEQPGLPTPPPLPHQLDPAPRTQASERG